MTRTIATNVALGVAEGAIENVGRQMVTGTSLTDLDYGEVASSAAVSGMASGIGTMAGIGLDALKQARVMRKLTDGANVLGDSNIDRVLTGAGVDVPVEGMAYRSGSSSMDYQAWNREYTESGMRIATVKEVRNYKKMMGKQGIKVTTDVKGNRLPNGMAAGFDYTTGEVVIKKNPTLLSLQHEGFHAKQWLEIGQEEYMKLGRMAREEYVYKCLVDSNLLNEVELSHSEWYINKVREGVGRR